MATGVNAEDDAGSWEPGVGSLPSERPQAATAIASPTEATARSGVGGVSQVMR